MLLKQEQDAYRIALAAVTGKPPLDGYMVCTACHGAGLLPHPFAHWHVAFCYVCSGTGVIPDQKDVAAIEGCGCVRAKTLPA